MYTIFLVTDREKHRRQLTHAVSQISICTLLGDAYSHEEAIAEISRCSPDVVLVDLAIGGGEGLSLIRKVSNKTASVALVAVAMGPGREVEKVRHALAAGATGFLRAVDVDTDLERAIVQAGRGGIFLSDALKRKITPKA